MVDTVLRFAPVFLAFLTVAAAPALADLRVPPADYAFQPVAGCPVATTDADHGYRVCDDQMAVLATAMDDARKSGKVLLVEIAASWCPQCHSLKRLLPGPDVLGNTGDGFDFAGRFAHVELVTSTLRGGRMVPVPSGEAALALIEEKLEGASMRGWPYLVILDPAAPDRALGFNTDGLMQSGGTHDPVRMRALLADSWRALRDGAPVPADPAPSLVTRIWRKLFGD